MQLPRLLIAPALVIAGIGLAPTAAADCTTAGNTTICSVGGSDGGGSGPVVPYPCGYDYYCNDDWGWFIP
ncbi:MAG TPA: hypothetical protein VIQ11_19370 [Mycobacterium sp.]